MSQRVQVRSRHVPSALAGVVRFVCAHPVPVSVTCLTAAGGRFAQAAWAEMLPSGASLALELVVAAARVALVLVVIGEGGIRCGMTAVRDFFARAERDHAAWFTRVAEQARVRWKQLVLEFVVFLALAILLNVVNGQLAALPAVVAWTSPLVDSPESARSANVLFLKNLSVIPLALLFQVRLVVLLAERDRCIRPPGRMHRS